MGVKGNWTPERVETLLKLHAEGLSASEIAKRLGAVSRNGVIGKLNRMWLIGRGADQLTKNVVKPGRRKPKASPSKAKRKSSPRKPKPAKIDWGPYLAASKPAIPDIDPAAQAKGFRLEELGDDQCRFPLRQVAAGSAQRFCGSRALAGKPYCGHHHALTTGVGTASERRATKLSGKNYAGTKRIGK